ncbi:DUF3450 family protein [Pseudoalteromonas luteoviolacea]|uniref:DUF3450 family protein n=1 Tax=Pseudoalteromonas luteoviolacea DSM 6061 TaxID=1365250 RepID=A0A161ZTC8_9GAMM|nr:DUF3450 family protein [Pseudoalteromonas luteoviolacea]KZN31779.1 hypothetical protein N475_04790 [Pseudoalteromonas luteoviolacea DSM 6061]KZN54639.1 hypothetical protein N474_02610 [Pseudoalteromonas luteoviolacea CPMOR-2]MBE0389116.1 hypothetical protein [Pseudoalteromonas luteoviolacea DSM 6061]TQF70516.1 DUF3450 domain-containing protein [Pseudoalteromonas luteoviolacea]
MAKYLRPMLVLTFWVMCFGASANQDIQLIDQWLKLEKQQSTLNSVWAERKTKLQQQISLLQKEQQELERLLERNRSNKNEVSQQRQKLITQQAEFEEYDASLATDLDNLVNYMQSVQPRLPLPLQKKWQETLITLAPQANSNKLDSILKLFKQAYDFDDQVVFHTGLVSFSKDESKSILAEQVYLGLSQGWYISADKQYYGYGRSDNSKWHWWHGPQTTQILGTELSNAQISAVTDIIKQPTRARYVQLPLAIERRYGDKL